MSKPPLRTARKQRVGRPFKPGRSGNPGGRPKSKAAREYLLSVTDQGREIIDRLLTIARRPGKASILTLKALVELRDMGLGRPVQTNQLTGADGESLPFMLPPQMAGMPGSVVDSPDGDDKPDDA